MVVMSVAVGGLIDVTKTSFTQHEFRSELLNDSIMQPNRVYVAVIVCLVADLCLIHLI